MLHSVQSLLLKGKGVYKIQLPCKNHSLSSQNCKKNAHLIVKAYSAALISAVEDDEIS